MTRTPIISIVTFLAGLAIGFYAHSVMYGFPRRLNDADLARIAQLQKVNPQTPNDAADLAAIEKLHKADVDSTLTQDPAALNLLWSDDCVKLDVPGGPVVGLKSLQSMYAKFRADYPEFHVLKYQPTITEIRIVDNWALEVGTFAATFQISPKNSPVTVNDKGARVLKRQPDGTWKLAVVGLK